MPRLSGYVFDHHDDVDGRIVRSAFPSYSDIPDFVKTASRLSEAAVEDLPDDQFALVLLDNGFKLKKYATVDAGNTALSVLYLLKQAHLLPPDAVKLAAINLIGACQYHNLDVPQELIKAAQTGAGMGVSGKGEIPYGPGAKVQKKTFSDPPRESRENPQLGNADAAWTDVEERVNRTGTPGVNDVQIPPFSPKEKQKTASEPMSTVFRRPDGHMHIEGPGGPQVVPYEEFKKTHGHLLKQYPELHTPMEQEHFNMFMGKTASASYETVLKQRVWREAPYFDASDWNPSEHEVTEEPSMPQRTLLDEKYPVDSFSQVKTASVYFNEKWREFHPRQRHEYCVKLASRMLELGLEVPAEMERYASTTYAADVDGYVGIRRSYVPEEFHSSLDLLIEKRAQVKPETFAETLAEFDRMTGLRLEWDAGIPDPWMSTFGPSFEKLADENWRWDKDGTRISKDDLENLARNGHELVAKTLGADFAKEFSKRPKEVFMSLPDPNKLILARMASDRNAGTGTE
jgi:hypothetical protein